jgi:peptide deformylase
MGVRPILTYPDPLLKKVARVAAPEEGEVRGLVEDMVETMYAAPGVGLAAPQIGSSLRVIVVDVSCHEEGSELIALVNPQILRVEGEVTWEEGCLSVPDLIVETIRSERVRIGGFDVSGRRLEFDAEGLLAIALQHEMDHLEGRLIIDRVSPLKRELYRKRRLRAAVQAEE